MGCFKEMVKDTFTNNMVSEPSVCGDNGVMSRRGLKSESVFQAFCVFSLILLKILVADKALQGLKISSFGF